MKNLLAILLPAKGDNASRHIKLPFDRFIWSVVIAAVSLTA